MIKEFNKLVCNLYHKSNYITHTRTLKQALNHLLVLKNVSEQFNLIKKHCSNDILI